MSETSQGTNNNWNKIPKILRRFSVVSRGSPTSERHLEICWHSRKLFLVVASKSWFVFLWIVVLSPLSLLSPRRSFFFPPRLGVNKNHRFHLNESFQNEVVFHSTPLPDFLLMERTFIHLQLIREWAPQILRFLLLFFILFPRTPFRLFSFSPYHILQKMFDK